MASDPVDGYFVYVLRNGAGTLYTGIAKDVDARCDAHNAGKGARFTRGRGPWLVAHIEGPLAHGDALREGHGGDSRADVWLAYAPYLIIVVVFALAQWGPVKDFLNKGVTSFTWPGLDVLTPKGDPAGAATYKLNWLPAAGSLLLICGVLTMLVLRVSPRCGWLRVIGWVASGLKPSTSGRLGLHFLPKPLAPSATGS